LTFVAKHDYGACMPVVEIATPNGPKIRRLRILRGYPTQKDLAAAIGRDRSWVSAMECNQRRQSLALMCKVADVLNVDVTEIIAA
jgi:transcriptional regulator with XRE-family HTH domain